MGKLRKTLGWLLVVLIIATVASIVPYKSRSATVPTGFHYGEPANQSVTTKNAELTRQWRGFPVPISEKEAVLYPGEGFYEATTYDIVKLNYWYIVINIIFWTGLIVALLSPITIFYRPKKKPVEVKPTEKKTESQVKQAYADTRD